MRNIITFYIYRKIKEMDKKYKYLSKLWQNKN